MDVFHKFTQQVAMVIFEINGNSWLLFGIYANLDYMEQKALWREVVRLIEQSIPSLFVGDFNYISRPQEKRRGRPYTDNIKSRKF